MFIENPKDIVWNEGDLPPVDSVPYESRILALFIHNMDKQYAEVTLRSCPHLYKSIEEAMALNGHFYHISEVIPHKDSLNPLRWCSTDRYPIGYQEKVKYWAWISKP